MTHEDKNIGQKSTAKDYFCIKGLEELHEMRDGLDKTN
jgi:hypothetical protein